MGSGCIGRLVVVESGRVLAEFGSDFGTYVETAEGQRFVGEVGSYVAVCERDRHVIAEIMGVEASARVQLSLVGEVVGGRFRFGVSRLPLIFSEVSFLSASDLSVMLAVSEAVIPAGDAPAMTRARSLSIGRSVVFPD